MQAFNVYLNKKRIDAVFYSNNVKVDKNEVYQSLVNHDGYEPGIKITKARKSKSAYAKLIS